MWQRLEETYGSPEVIEHALLQKLENFPRISNKDSQHLRELGDLLVEVESAKAGGHLPGLAYLDTTRVNPIIEKLPYGLQERWVVQGSKYKETQHVSFPPFSYFVDFICKQAKIRNDPSFAFSTPSSFSYSKTERPWKYNSPRSVSVRKMDVSSLPSACQESTFGKTTDEPHDRCPIHNKPHPLPKCCGFRGKHLDEGEHTLRKSLFVSGAVHPRDTWLRTGRLQ